MTQRKYINRYEKELVARVGRRVREFGGELLYVNSDERQRLMTGGNLRRMTGGLVELEVTEPASSDAVACNWREKKIYVVVDDMDPSWDVAILIHEMGHIFASKLHPDSCNEQDFLGWEYLMARELGMYRKWASIFDGYVYSLPDNVPACLDHLRKISVCDTLDLGQLKRSELESLMAERVDWAKSLGIVRDGKAVAIR